MNRSLFALAAFAILSTGSGPASAQCLETVYASDGITNFDFGASVAASDDVVLIGAPRAKAGVIFEAGACYVHRENGPLWPEEQKLTASDAADSDKFGFAVSVAGDRAVVGAPYDDDQGTISGSAYAFTYSGGTWSQTQKLLASTGTPQDMFGSSVALFGSICAVGAPGKNNPGTDEGGVFVFNEVAGVWNETASIKPFDSGPNYQFGFSLDLYSQTLAVGAPFAGGGAVYVYEKIGTTWLQKAKLVPSGSASGGDDFGYSTSIWGDKIAVGAKDGVYTFQKTVFGWAAVAYIQFPNVSDSYIVDLAGDILVIGSKPSSTAARIYQWTGSTWALKAVKEKFFSQFGSAVALSDHAIAIGDPGDAALGSAAGSTDVGSYLPLLQETSFDACPLAIDVSTGGAQNMSLHVGVEHAAEWYFVLGSLSGDVPGFSLGAYHIPLNPDVYFDFTLKNPNNPPPLGNTLGLLDEDGLASATIVWPAGFVSSLIGATLYHAFVAFDLSTLAVTAASNSTKVLLVP